MAIVLGRGEFFGRVVTAAQWEPFRMSETRYARGALLPWHRHDESYLTFVLAGGYRERSVRQTQSCAARSIVLHPAGETHEDDFSEQPARCLNVVLAPRSRRVSVPPPGRWSAVAWSKVLTWRASAPASPRSCVAAIRPRN